MMRLRQHILFFIFLTLVSTACGKEPLPAVDSLVNDSPQKNLIPQYATIRWFQLSMLGIEPYTSSSSPWFNRFHPPTRRIQPYE